LPNNFPVGALTTPRAFFAKKSRAGNQTDRILDWIVAIRILVGLSMILYILFAIATGFNVPFVKRYSAYLYFAIAATVPVIYWTRPVGRRRAASTAQFQFFTIFLLGNWFYTLFFHLRSEGLITHGWVWLFVWASELYIEGALLRGHPFDPCYPLTALRMRLKARETLIHELEETKTQLSHANRILTLTALADTITHEINQPLAAVVVNAEAAKRWLMVQDLENARKALTRVVDDGHRASAVITSFHRLLKEGEPRRVPVDIGDLIEQALDIHDPEIKSNNVNVRLLNWDAIPVMSCDPVQIKQVFLNLIANAIDALSETSRRNRNLILRYEGIRDGRATIAVEDNGAGISDTEQIWKLFYSTKAKGTGMGLFISRMIVEAHGGSLTVRSLSGRTGFYVSLPLEISQQRYDSVRGGERPVAAPGDRELAEFGWASR
jgi:signal transduction histidine kinase